MIHNKTIHLFFLLLIMSSCFNGQGKPKVQNKEAEKADYIISSTTMDGIYTSDINSPELKKLLADVKFRELPFKDSTNFDNMDVLCGKKLDDATAAMLKLEIQPEYYYYTLNYWSRLQEGIYSLTVSKISEMELYTKVINYDDNLNLIDELLIAYDEIAESWSRTISDISETAIVVRNINYFNEVPEYSKIEYKTVSDGTFRKAGNMPPVLFSTEDLYDTAYWVTPEEYPLKLSYPDGSVYNNEDDVIRLPDHNGFEIIIWTTEGGDTTPYSLTVIKDGTIHVDEEGFGLDLTPSWSEPENYEDTFCNKRFKIYENYSLIQVDTEEAAENDVKKRTYYYIITEEGRIKETDENGHIKEETTL